MKNKKTLLSVSAVVLCLVILCAVWRGITSRPKLSATQRAMMRDFEAFRALPEAKQKYVLDWIKQGEIYRMTSSYQPDVDRAKKELASNPNSEIALRTLARYEYYKDNGRYHEAIRLMKKACQINPANQYYYWELGQLTRFTGDDQGAIPYFQKAIALGGYYAELARRSLKDINVHPNLLQSDCTDCTKGK